MIARAPQPSPKLVLSARLGLISVPETDRETVAVEAGFDRSLARSILQALGRSLGMEILPAGQEAFPDQDPGVSAPALDEAVRRTLEKLDVVWMDGEDVVAGFVVEAKIGGWEGIRRLADLLALHPKLKAPLYAVTMPSLEAGILAEVRRPAYRLLKKPLSESLRFLDWERLQTEVEQLGERVRYLKPEFLDGISDPVDPPAEA